MHKETTHALHAVIHSGALIQQLTALITELQSNILQSDRDEISCCSDMRRVCIHGFVAIIDAFVHVYMWATRFHVNLQFLVHRQCI